MSVEDGTPAAPPSSSSFLCRRRVLLLLLVAIGTAVLVVLSSAGVGSQQQQPLLVPPPEEDGNANAKPSKSMFKSGEEAAAAAAAATAGSHEDADANQQQQQEQEQREQDEQPKLKELDHQKAESAFVAWFDRVYANAALQGTGEPATGAAERAAAERRRFRRFAAEEGLLVPPPAQQQTTSSKPRPFSVLDSFRAVLSAADGNSAAAAGHHSMNSQGKASNKYSEACGVVAAVLDAMDGSSSSKRSGVQQQQEDGAGSGRVAMNPFAVKEERRYFPTIPVTSLGRNGDGDDDDDGPQSEVGVDTNTSAKDVDGTIAAAAGDDEEAIVRLDGKTDRRGPSSAIYEDADEAAAAAMLTAAPHLFLLWSPVGSTGAPRAASVAAAIHAAYALRHKIASTGGTTDASTTPPTQSQKEGSSSAAPSVPPSSFVIKVVQGEDSVSQLMSCNSGNSNVYGLLQCAAHILVDDGAPYSRMTIIDLSVSPELPRSSKSRAAKKRSTAHTEGGEDEHARGNRDGSSGVEDDTLVTVAINMALLSSGGVAGNRHALLRPHDVVFFPGAATSSPAAQATKDPLAAAGGDGGADRGDEHGDDGGFPNPLTAHQASVSEQGDDAMHGHHAARSGCGAGTFLHVARLLQWARHDVSAAALGGQQREGAGSDGVTGGLFTLPAAWASAKDAAAKAGRSKKFGDWGGEAGAFRGPGGLRGMLEDEQRHLQRSIFSFGGSSSVVPVSAQRTLSTGLSVLSVPHELFHRFVHLANGAVYRDVPQNVAARIVPLLLVADPFLGATPTSSSAGQQGVAHAKQLPVRLRLVSSYAVASPFESLLLTKPTSSNKGQGESPSAFSVSSSAVPQFGARTSVHATILRTLGTLPAAAEATTARMVRSATLRGYHQQHGAAHRDAEGLFPKLPRPPLAPNAVKRVDAYGMPLTRRTTGAVGGVTDGADAADILAYEAEAAGRLLHHHKRPRKKAHRGGGTTRRQLLAAGAEGHGTGSSPSTAHQPSAFYHRHPTTREGNDAGTASASAGASIKTAAGSSKILPRRGVCIVLYVKTNALLAKNSVAQYIRGLRFHFRRVVVVVPRSGPMAAAAGGTSRRGPRMPVAAASGAASAHSAPEAAENGVVPLPVHCQSNHATVACLHFLAQLRDVRESAGMLFLHADAFLNPTALFGPGRAAEGAFWASAMQAEGKNDEVPDDWLLWTSNSDERFGGGARGRGGGGEGSRPEEAPGKWPEDLHVVWSRTMRSVRTFFDFSTQRASSSSPGAMLNHITGVRFQAFSDAFYVPAQQLEFVHALTTTMQPFLLFPESAVPFLVALTSAVTGTGRVEVDVEGHCCTNLSPDTIAHTTRDIGHRVMLSDPATTRAMSTVLTGGFEQCSAAKAAIASDVLSISGGDGAVVPTSQNAEVAVAVSNMNALPGSARGSFRGPRQPHESAVAGSKFPAGGIDASPLCSTSSHAFVFSTPSTCAVRVAVSVADMKSAASEGRSVCVVVDAPNTNTIRVVLPSTDTLVDSTTSIQSIAVHVHAPNGREVVVAPADAQDGLSAGGVVGGRRASRGRAGRHEVNADDDVAVGEEQGRSGNGPGIAVAVVTGVMGVTRVEDGASGAELAVLNRYPHDVLLVSRLTAKGLASSPLMLKWGADTAAIGPADRLAGGSAALHGGNDGRVVSTHGTGLAGR